MLIVELFESPINSKLIQQKHIFIYCILAQFHLTDKQNIVRNENDTKDLEYRWFEALGLYNLCFMLSYSVYIAQNMKRRKIAACAWIYNKYSGLVITINFNVLFYTRSDTVSQWQWLSLALSGSHSLLHWVSVWIYLCMLISSVFLCIVWLSLICRLQSNAIVICINHQWNDCTVCHWI